MGTVGTSHWTMHQHRHHHKTVLAIFLLTGLSLSMARELPRVRFTNSPLSLRRENYRLLQRGSDVRRTQRDGNSADTKEFIPFNSQTMKADNQGAPWWTNLNSNSERNKTEEAENIAPPEEDESEPKKLLHYYKRIIEKNTELMRLLMRSFQAQAEQLDKLMIV